MEMVGWLTRSRKNLPRRHGSTEKNRKENQRSKSKANLTTEDTEKQPGIRRKISSLPIRVYSRLPVPACHGFPAKSLLLLFRSRRSPDQAITAIFLSVTNL